MKGWYSVEWTYPDQEERFWHRVGFDVDSHERVFVHCALERSVQPIEILSLGYEIDIAGAVVVSKDNIHTGATGSDYRLICLQYEMSI